MKVGAQGGICMFHSWSLCVGFFFMLKPARFYIPQNSSCYCTFSSIRSCLVADVFYMHGSLFYMLAQIFIVVINCWPFLFSLKWHARTPRGFWHSVYVSLSQKMSILEGGSNIVKRMLYLLRTRMLHAVLYLVSGLFSERTMFITVPGSYGCSAHCFMHSAIATCSDFTHEWSTFASAVKRCLTPVLCCLIAIYVESLAAASWFANICGFSTVLNVNNFCVLGVVKL